MAVRTISEMVSLKPLYAKSYTISTMRVEFRSAQNIKSNPLNRVQMRQKLLSLQNSRSISFRSL